MDRKRLKVRYDEVSWAKYSKEDGWKEILSLGMNQCPRLIVDI